MSTSNDQAIRLLLVDDELHVRMVLTRALGGLGFEVEAVDSGPKALARLAEASYDVMLLDIRMPDMDGVEVMHHVRQSHPDLPIIVLTGHGTLRSAIAALRLGAADYLLKPAGVHEIAAAVKQALERSSAEPSAYETAAGAEWRPPLPPVDAPPVRWRHVPPITVDHQTRLVSVEDNPPRQAELTEGELAVLSALISHPNLVLTWSQLARLAFGHANLDEPHAQSIIRPYIFRLRRKLEARPRQPRLIRTVRGRGYVFSPDTP